MLPDLTMKRSHSAAGAAMHEAGHAWLTMVFGGEVKMMRIDPPAPGRAFTGVTDAKLGRVKRDPQRFAIVLQGGLAAEIPLLHKLGYTEKSHPELLKRVREQGGAHDLQRIAKLVRKYPGMVDADRAAEDAARILEHPRMHEGKRQLAEELIRNGRLNSAQVARIAEPFQPQEFLQETGLELWKPSPVEIARARADRLPDLKQGLGRAVGRIRTGGSRAGRRTGVPKQPVPRRRR
ncbi:MAG: hypothetical protein M0026_11965 [Nocardiopsaceae bacterium]|nr:hypothetical protein [Nocardiopsaceae bacterium]